MIRACVKTIFFLGAFIILAGGESHAQTPPPECTTENGVVVDDYPISNPGRAGPCQSRASYYEFFFETFMVCTGFPELGTFSNCQDLEITPTAVKITETSATSVAGMLPLPGAYTYSVSLVSPEIKVAGMVEFETQQMAGAAPQTTGFSFGRYCQQKPETFVFSEVVAESFDETVGNTYCQTTPFAESEITPSTMILDDFIFSSDYRATNHLEFDPSQDFNAVAINSDGQIATNGPEVESLLLVTKLKEPLIVKPSDNTIEFTYSLERGLANERFCPPGGYGNGANCLLAWFYMGGTNARVRTY